jgi:hypothetical protein
MLDLALQMSRAEARQIRYLDVLMPNGKKLADCTGDYVAEVGEAMQNTALKLGYGAIE